MGLLWYGCWVKSVRYIFFLLLQRTGSFARRTIVMWYAIQELNVLGSVHELQELA